MLTIRPWRVVRAVMCWCVLMAGLAAGQPARAQDEATFEGTVVSSSRNTITVEGPGRQYRLFVLERGTRRPGTMSVGTRVRVTSSPGDDPTFRVADEVTVVDSPAAQAKTGTSAVIPSEIRRLERDIERQVRRYSVGVRAGVALDPELVLVGVHAQVGPFFASNIYFRPNVEFAFGEVTAMFALNPEVIYRLPVTARQGRWNAYVGVGPGFNFLHQNFEREEGDSRIDFGDFKSDVGLNILGGLRSRGGTFVELKTTVYSDPSPTLRLIVGYNF